jgi:hypothetical protein
MKLIHKALAPPAPLEAQNRYIVKGTKDNYQTVILNLNSYCPAGEVLHHPVFRKPPDEPDGKI